MTFSSFLRDLLPNLGKYRIILGSGSPRRKEILENLGLSFDINPSSFDESTLSVSMFKDVDEFVISLAEGKTNEVFDRLLQQNVDENKDESFLVIGSDTIVCIDEEILGKPKTPEKAVEMLSLLSGKSHQVKTAISIRTNSQVISRVETTNVKFKVLTDSEIQTYVDTKDPLDKAGAYGIQSLASIFIESIEGCYYNVVGLPIYLLYSCFQEINFE
eukprot:TRINITY_DN4569_c0_g1_i1.p1 TRINITY_DN4569_c0_g1~~TRINITY_DN4569_c0_g1_i1.p1  ORF type:complete len:216 (+),score=51.21 TRINITY_DN4569_c0_g1_i1:121-768(+)